MPREEIKLASPLTRQESFSSMLPAPAQAVPIRRLDRRALMLRGLGASHLRRLIPCPSRLSRKRLSTLTLRTRQTRRYLGLFVLCANLDAAIALARKTAP